jgi:methyltransferase
MNPYAIFFVVIGFVICQRLWELRVAKLNTSALLRKGGIEFGRSHYWLLVTLHSLFFVSLISEAYIRGITFTSLTPLYFLIFLCAQAARLWVIFSLNGRWTTRIVVLPGEKLIRRGPFRYVSHPNYIVVAIELAILPLTFGLTITAAAFTILNALVLLYVRIPSENKALKWALARGKP